MIQELIYTSAPQGLRAGSSGYCTVAMTHGMSPPLVDQLEALSGYRHVFQPGEAQAASNPINHSFLKLTVGGIRYFVLSRVADAGFDHTHRTNKLAHHLVLDGQEIEKCPAGPAAALALPRFMHETWQGEPRNLVPAKKEFPHVAPLRVCSAWKQLTGDAGYAGVLAEAVVRRTPQDLCILFEPGMPLLALVVEAMSLLTPSERWNATFSTYYTKLPPGIECRWRFILAGSPEAKMAARLPNVRTITLGGAQPKADGGEYANAARSGLPVQRAAETTSAPAGTVVNFAQTKQAPQLTLDESDSHPSGSYGLGPPPPRNAVMQGMTVPRSNPSFGIKDTRSPFGARPKWQIPAIAAAAVLLLLGLVGGAYWWGKSANRTLPLAEKMIADGTLKPNDNPEPTKIPGPVAATPSAIVPKVKETPPEPQPVALATAHVMATPAPTPTSTPSAQMPQTRKTETREAFSDLEKRGLILEIPKSTTGNLNQAGSGELCRIAVEDLQDCELELIGADSVFGRNRQVTLDSDLQPNHNVKNWVLNYAATGLPGGQINKKPFARLGLSRQTGSLAFAWEAVMPDGIKSDVGALNFCMLKVTVGGRSELCQFIKTRTTLPVLLAPTGQDSASAAPKPNRLRIEFTEADKTAAVQLIPSGDVIAVSATNPNLNVTLSPRKVAQMEIPPSVALEPPRKGLRFDLRTAEVDVPCNLELEFCDIPSGNTKTLAARASVFVSGFNIDPQKKLLLSENPEPFSYADYKQKVATLDKRFKQHSIELLAITKERDETANDVKILRAIIDDPKADAARKSGAQGELKAANYRLKNIHDGLNKNKNFQSLVVLLEEVPKLGDQYIKIASRLKEFQNSFVFDYEVRLKYPEREILLLKSEDVQSQ